MANTNVVVLTGRCVKSAELKYTTGGMAICTFSIAVNERVHKKNSDEYENRPNFFDVTCYGNYGKAMQTFLTKGREVTVAGKLHQDRWESEGKSYSRITIIAQNLEPQREPKGNSGNYSNAADNIPPDAYEPSPDGEQNPFM